MQIFSLGDNLHEISVFCLGKNKKNISEYHLLKFLPTTLSVKVVKSTEVSNLLRDLK